MLTLELQGETQHHCHFFQFGFQNFDPSSYASLIHRPSTSEVNDAQVCYYIADYYYNEPIIMSL